MITAVGVVVPAHNEADRIRSCLRAVRAALHDLGHGVRVAVTIVLDRCSDETPVRVAAELLDWPVARAVALRRRTAGTGVGLVRAVGMRDVVHRLHPAPLEQMWLLSTDADTEVPRTWVAGHLRYARNGAHGVAGRADLHHDTKLSRPARTRYNSIVSRRTAGTTHRNVYAANLGVRADAYLRCGGFPSEGPGEEHRLWRAMADAGCRLAQPTDLHVRTSGRLHGRARGGLADLLRSLETR